MDQGVRLQGEDHRTRQERREQIIGWIASAATSLLAIAAYAMIYLGWWRQ